MNRKLKEKKKNEKKAEEIGRVLAVCAARKAITDLPLFLKERKFLSAESS